MPWLQQLATLVCISLQWLTTWRAQTVSLHLCCSTCCRAAPPSHHCACLSTSLTSRGLTCCCRMAPASPPLLSAHSTLKPAGLAGSVDLEASRSSRECSWESLEFEMGPLCGSFLQQLAYLPLRGVRLITMPYGAETTENLDYLHVPLTEFKTAAQRRLLRAAAVNLAASKAWQISPTTSITFIASRGDNSCLRKVLHALAPLGGEHIRALTITGTEEVKGGGDYQMAFPLSKADVEALAASLGSAITSIDLDYCELGPKSWPALARCFPAVTTLSPGEEVMIISQVRTIHLAMWANLMGHPLTILLKDPYPYLCTCDDGVALPPAEWPQPCDCMQKLQKVLEDFGVQVTIKYAGRYDHASLSD